MQANELIQAVQKRQALAAQVQSLDVLIARAAAAVLVPVAPTAPTPGPKPTGAPAGPRTPPEAPRAPRTGVGSGGRAKKVVTFIEQHPGQDLTPAGVSAASGVKLQIVQTVMGRLLAAGRMARIGHGLYRAAKGAPAPAA